MKKILVIDDEPEFLELMRRRLSPTYEVFTAVDGDEGLRAAIEKKPDLIISDILMPKKDGYQFVREARQSAELRAVPILLLTTVGDSSSMMRADELGATDYLIKPVEFAELPALIERYLRGGRPV